MTLPPVQPSPPALAVNVDAPSPSPRPTRAEFLLIAAVTALVGAFFPYFEEVRSANELSRVYLVNALLEDRSVSIDGPFERLGHITDRSLRDGKRYCDKAPGISFVGLPIVAATRAVAGKLSLRDEVRLLRVWLATVPMGLALLLMAFVLARYVPDRDLRLVMLAAFGTGTLMTTYGELLFSHSLSAALLFGIHLAIPAHADDKVRLRAPIVGLLTSIAVCVEYQNVIFLLPLGVFFVMRVRARPVPIGFALLGALPFAILLGAYHHAAFGSPFKTGYSFVESAFAKVHEEGFLGISWPRPSNLQLSFLSADKGLFFFSPFLALALPGLPLLWRVRPEGRIHLVMLATIVLFVSSMVYAGGGWTVSQRHFTVLVPWLALPLGLALMRWPALQPVFAGLVVPSVVVTGLSSVVWPHYQYEFTNPFFQMGWPLFADGFAPPNALGDLIGLPTRWLVSAAAAAWIVGLLAWILRSVRAPSRIAIAILVTVALPLAYFRIAPRHGKRADIAHVRHDTEAVYEVDPAAHIPGRIERRKP